MSDKRYKKHKKAKKGKGIFTRLIIACILLITGVGLPKLLALSPAFVENFYTQRLYPAMRQAVGFLPSLTRVSFTEVGAWCLLAVCLAIIVDFTVKLFSGRLTLIGTISFWVSIVLIAGIALNVFNLVGGLNYHTVTLDKKLDLTVKPRTNDQLYGYCTYLRGEAQRLRADVSVNEKGIFAVDDVDAALRKVAHDVECVDELNPWLISVPAAKKFMLPKALTVFGISGICMPFFAEANVNTEQPSLLMLSSAAHENAHYLGIAREDEANFAAFLACISSEDVNIRYSGVMLGFIESANRLYEADKGLYTELMNGLSAQVRADISDYYAYWQGTDDSITGKISTAVNDAYLKYNGAESGERSYGEMVDLLLAYYAKCNGSE